MVGYIRRLFGVLAVLFGLAGGIFVYCGVLGVLSLCLVYSPIFMGLKTWDAVYIMGNMGAPNMLYIGLSNTCICTKKKA